MVRSAADDAARLVSRSKEGKQPNLLLIFPGPVHDIADHFKDRLERLSAHYGGVLLVSANDDQRLTLGNFDVIAVRERKTEKLGSFLVLLARARAAAHERALRGEGFDAVVSYDPLRSGLIGWLVAREYGVPLMTEINGDYAAAENYADIPNALMRRVKQTIFVQLARFVLRRAKGIKLLNDSQITPFRTVLRDPVIRTFPNYVDLVPYKNLGDSPEVLFIGHPFHRKGVDILIRAFKLVSDDYPDWRLTIIGWFPDPTLLSAAIAGHPRIEARPPVFHRDIPMYLGRCGIFVLPSRSEAMGRVLIEAMACGKARIGSNVGGIPTVIDHAVDGLLVRPGDVEDLAGALRCLMHDEALRLRLGRNGELRARERLSPAVYFDRVRDLYDTVLERSRVAH
ncbi:MAG: glycosyltransferase family 4 protein [Gemmatimonadota bacterium]